MEARDGARRVTQRQLEIPAEAPGPRAPPPAESDSSTRPDPLAENPPPSREPSNLGLRERQVRWLRERARFDAATAKTVAPSEGSK